MGSEENRPPTEKLTALGQKAEKALRGQPVDPADLSTGDLEQMLHELQVQQIELQMQNEELRRTQAELEKSRSNYADLYDFAPVGYFTLGEKGLILEANLTGANLLGEDRTLLLQKPLSRFISPADQDRFYLHRRHVLNTKTRQQCKLQLVKQDGSTFWAQLESIAVPTGEETAERNMRTAVLDISQAIRAEVSLREREQQFRTLVEHSVDGIVLTDEQGIIIEWNRGAEQVFGLQAREVLGRPLWEVQFQVVVETQRTPAMHDFLQDGVLELCQTGQAPWLNQPGEIQVQRPDGERRTIQQSVFPIRTVRGGMIGSICRDITRHKQAEEAIRALNANLEARVKARTAQLMAVNKRLTGEIAERVQAEEAVRRSEALYRTLVQTSPDAVVITDVTGTIIEVSQQALKMLGDGTGEQLAGLSIFDFVAPAEHDRVRASIREILSGGIISRNVEYTLLQRNGEPFNGEVNAALIRNAGGQPKTFVITIRNITKRKQTQAALQKSEERFHQVIASISDHVYVTQVTKDGKHENIYLSHHVETLTGYPRDKFWADWSFWPTTVIHPDDRATAAAQAARLDTGQNSEVEYRLIRADGSIIWVRDSARTQSWGDSRIIYGLVSNITERKQAEAEIRELYAGLEQRVADRTRELSALYEVTAVASQSLDLQTTLEHVLDRVLAAMESTAGDICLLDETGDILRLVAFKGLPPHTVVQSVPGETSVCPATWVIEHNQPLMIPNIAVDPRACREAQLMGLQTYVGAPIRAGGQVLGALNIFGETTQQFNVEEVALLASIADQLGIAVESARLRQRAEQAAITGERQRLARDLHDSLTQSLYSLALFAEAGGELTRAGDLDAVKNNFTRMGEMTQQALKEMRLLVHELRPLDLAQVGLVEALKQRLATVEERAPPPPPPPASTPGWWQKNRSIYRRRSKKCSIALPRRR